MKLYRGQPYGAPVGNWWTPDIEYARSHVRAAQRSWVVLEIDCPDELLAAISGNGVYIMDVAAYARAARIVDGHLPV